MIVCPFCYKRFNSNTSFFLHVKIWHKVMMSSICKCHQEGCSRTFNNFYASNRHLLLKHCVSEHMFDRAKIENVGIDNLFNFPNLESDLIGLNPTFTSPTFESVHTENSFNESLVLNIKDFESITQKEILSFVSQLYSVSILPRSFISSLIAKLNNLYNQTLIPILQQKCNSTDPKQSLSDLTQMLTIMQHGFDNFKTDYRSLQYFESLGVFIKPQAINIFALLNSRLVGGKRKAVVSNIEIQVIPIKMVLKKFLELPNVLSTILAHIQECKRSEAIVSNLQIVEKCRVEI